MAQLEPPLFWLFGMEFEAVDPVLLEEGTLQECEAVQCSYLEQPDCEFVEFYILQTVQYVSRLEETT